MRTRYRYIHFDDDRGLFDGQQVYTVMNNRTNTPLGCVEWYAEWRQWVFSGYQNAVWSASCLRDVLAFMAQLPAEGPAS